MGEVIYKDKKSALKAKVCYLCECKMDGAFVVATMHGKKELHFPLCSPGCLEEMGDIIGEAMIEKQKG